MNDSECTSFFVIMSTENLVRRTRRIRRSTVADWTEGLRGDYNQPGQTWKPVISLSQMPILFPDGSRTGWECCKKAWQETSGVRWRASGWRLEPGTQACSQNSSSALPLHYHMNPEDVGKKNGMGESPGPAEGQIHMELPSPGMNSEWDGCCCWNLPHSPFFCEQDDQWQEGSFADGPHYK